MHYGQEELDGQRAQAALRHEPERAMGRAETLPWLLTLLLFLLSPFVYDLTRWLLRAMRAT